jgi:hypothetical protein
MRRLAKGDQCFVAAPGNIRTLDLGISTSSRLHAQNLPTSELASPKMPTPKFANVLPRLTRKALAMQYVGTPLSNRFIVVAGGR